MNWRFWLLVLVCSATVLVSRWESNRTDAVPEETPGRAGEPDLFMGKATITQYSDAGVVRYRLESAEVLHYDADGLTRLSAPALTLNRAPQSPWFARAGEGFVKEPDASSADTAEVILLRDDVHLEQKEPNRIEIACSTLNIYPDRRFAETDRPVIIDSASGRSSAVGMSGDLESGLFKLSSNANQRVHTIVSPAQFKRAISPS
jgi:lipopolysaccharide export system protein LptC